MTEVMAVQYLTTPQKLTKPTILLLWGYYYLLFRMVYMGDCWGVFYEL